MLTFLNLYKFDYTSHKPVLWSHLFHHGYRFTILQKSIYDHTKKGLWIVGGPAIIFADIKTKEITTPFLNQSFTKINLHEELAYQYPVGLFLDSKQNLWFSVWQGFVYKYNTVTFQKEMYEVYAENNKSKKQSKPLSNCFGEDNNGKIWIGTEEWIILL